MQTTLKSIEPSATSYSVDLIDPRQIHIIWPDAARMLAPAIEQTGGRLSLSSVLSWLTAGHYQLWLVHDDAGPKAVIVTEIRNYPTGMRTLNMILLGGDGLDSWLHLWPNIERWAAEHGCIKAEMTGRSGWARVLKDWRQTMIDMEKDIIDG